MSDMAATTADKSGFNTVAPKWVNSLLVIGIGYALAVLSLKLLPQPEIQVTRVDPTTISTDRRPVLDKLQLSRQIASVKLFGDATEPAKEKPKRKEPIAKTKLNLKLTGVAAYEPQERAIAIINTGGANEAAFKVGEKIIGQTTLKAVYPDRVILDNNGREEVLELPETVTPIAVRQPNVQRQQQNNVNNAQASNSGPIDNLPQTPGALRDTLAKNPSMLGRIVSAEPYQENGKLRGYRITPKQNPEILESQGIIAGDVITRVNNIELNSQKQGVRALRNAVKAQSLEVTVLRDGVEIPLSISLAQ